MYKAVNVSKYLSKKDVFAIILSDVLFGILLGVLILSPSLLVRGIATVPFLVVTGIVLMLYGKAQAYITRDELGNNPASEEENEE